MEEVDWVSKLLPIQKQLDDAVVGCLGHVHQQSKFARFVNGKLQGQLVTRLGVSPPQVRIVAPVTGKTTQLLFLRVASRF